MTITIAADSERLLFFAVGGCLSGFRMIRPHASTAMARNMTAKTARKMLASRIGLTLPGDWRPNLVD